MTTDQLSLKIFAGSTPSQVYQTILTRLLYTPETRVAPRGCGTSEILNAYIQINNPRSTPIITADPQRNVVVSAYTAKEFKLYERGTKNVEDFAAAAKFWGKLANPDGTINSAYGHLVFHNKSVGNPRFEFDSMSKEAQPGAFVPEEFMRTPWEWALQSLLLDPDTRQAVVHFNQPSHCWRGNKDVVCTLNGQFFIRRDAHNNQYVTLQINMRSQDCWKGVSYDFVWFCWLIEKMREDLAAARPDLYSNLLVGPLVETVGSLHLYDSDRDAALKAVGVIPKGA